MADEMRISMQGKPLLFNVRETDPRMAVRHVGRVLRMMETLAKGTLSDEGAESRRQEIARRVALLGIMDITCPDSLEEVRELYQQMGGR